MADRGPARFAGPIVAVVIGLAGAAASSGLALGPGVADVEQPVAKALFCACLIVVLAGIVWGIAVRQSPRP